MNPYQPIPFHILSDKLFSTTTSECPYDLPKKQNLRILNINCRSVKENNAEFKTALEYIKPDIICGTESWLRGKKNLENLTVKAQFKILKFFLTIIQSLEMTEARGVEACLSLYSLTSQQWNVLTL